MLDIRIPIGYLFLIIGGLLTIYGVVHPQFTTLDLVGAPGQKSIELNLPCGISMFVFACTMLALAYADKSGKKKAAPDRPQTNPGETP
jgi:hypothetical protein